MRFGERLKNILKELGVSVTQLSEDLACTRPTVYAIFRGEKSLSMDAFKKILNSYSFLPSQVAELEALFFAETISPAKLDALKALEDEIAHFGVERTAIHLPLRKLVPTEEGVLISGSVDYYSAISAFLENEKDSEGEIFTNYSFFDTLADSLLFRFAKQNKNGPFITHTVKMDETVELKERLRNIGSAVKFIQFGHKVNISDHSKDYSTFATYFVGEKTVLQYDKESDCGFLTTDKETVFTFRNAAQENEKHKTPLGKESRGAVEFFDNLSVPNRNFCVCFDFRFPANYYVTKEILSDVLNSDLPGRETVLEQYWSLLEKFKNLQSSGFCSQKSCLRFVQDGIADDASPLFLNSISVENRIKLLKAFRQSIDNDYKMKITSSDYLPCKERCGFEIYRDGIALAFHSKIDPELDFTGGCLIAVTDNELADLLYNFELYSILSGNVLSAEHAKSFLDSLIAQCTTMLASDSK